MTDPLFLPESPPLPDYSDLSPSPPPNPATAIMHKAPRTIRRSSASAPYARPSPRHTSNSPDPLGFDLIMTDLEPPRPLTPRSRKTLKIDPAAMGSPQPAAHYLEAESIVRSASDPDYVHRTIFSPGSLDWLQRRLQWRDNPVRRQSHYDMTQQYRELIVDALLLHRVIEKERDKFDKVRRLAVCEHCQENMFYYSMHPQTLQCGCTYCLPCVRKMTKGKVDLTPDTKEPMCPCGATIMRYKPNDYAFRLCKALKDQGGRS